MHVCVCLLTGTSIQLKPRSSTSHTSVPVEALIYPKNKDRRLREVGKMTAVVITDPSYTLYSYVKGLRTPHIEPVTTSRNAKALALTPATRFTVNHTQKIHQRTAIPFVEPITTGTKLAPRNTRRTLGKRDASESRLSASSIADSPKPSSGFGR